MILNKLYELWKTVLIYDWLIILEIPNEGETKIVNRQNTHKNAQKKDKSIKWYVINWEITQYSFCPNQKQITKLLPTEPLIPFINSNSSPSLAAMALFSG